LKKDKDVVLAAVINGNSLMDASQDLLNDKEIILAAVKGNFY
jgi:hypothetical protein